MFVSPIRGCLDEQGFSEVKNSMFYTRSFHVLIFHSGEGEMLGKEEKEGLKTRFLKLANDANSLVVFFSTKENFMQIFEQMIQMYIKSALEFVD